MSLGSQPCCDASPFPYVELGELVEFRRGLTYGKSDEVEFSSTAVLRANNVDLASGQLDLSEIRYISDEVEVPRSKKLIANSLLICTASGSRSHLGKMAHVSRELDFAFGGFMGLLVPRSELSPKYLWYFSRSSAYREHLESTSPGANINNLRFDDLARLALPLPPLDEQKRIVAALDQAFAALDRARADTESNLNLVEGLLQGALDASFEAISAQSESMALQDAVHPDCGLSYGIVQPGDEVDGGLPIVRPVDLTQREIGLDGLKRIDPEAARGYSRTTLQGGELLLCVRGSTGTVSVASEQLAGANVTRGLVPIRFDRSRVMLDFAYFQFRSGLVRSQIAEKTYGAALMQINIKDLRALRFLVPDMDAQRELVERSEAVLADTEALRRSYVAHLNDIAELRQSLLQAAFSGQLS